MQTQAKQKFDLIVKSTIICADKPTTGLTAIPAPVPQQMDRIKGFLPDGEEVFIAKRPGKGGMDFNKICGGKVYAVAADGFSPVYEKSEDKKPTKVIKVEEGAKLYSSSGFYLLSSKDYPSIKLLNCYTRLVNNGTQVLLVSDDQAANQVNIAVATESDLSAVLPSIAALLGDEYNLVSPFDGPINKKRQRAITRNRQDVEDSDEPYIGVEYEDLAVNKKDGNPFVLVSWYGSSGPKSALIQREVLVENEKGQTWTKPLIPDEAVANFINSELYRSLVADLSASDRPINVKYTQGNLMRTSVSFKRKVENVFNADNAPVYGDAIYIKGAMECWCRGIVSIMYSQHPRFPFSDYTSNNYVAAPRQAELGMNKLEGSWTRPVVVNYDHIFG